MVAERRVEVPAAEAVRSSSGPAFCTAKILLAAVELQVFTVLSDRAATAGELCKQVPLHPRGSRDFFEALTVLGLLELQDGRYRNSPEADRYLVEGRPAYVGGFLQRANDMLYPAWGRLAEGLRSGRPQAVADFTEMARDPGRLAGFIDMMDALNGALAPQLAQSFDWSGYESVADIGGARGNLLAHVVKAHPHLRADVFDLPPMQPFFAEHMAKLGMTGASGLWPATSSSTRSRLTTCWCSAMSCMTGLPRERRMLAVKAFDALPEGGALMVYDRMLEEEPTDVTNLVISLSMLLTTPGGSEYTVGECRSWLNDAGFANVSAARLGARDTLVVARKGS